jgi:hypothetical protein
MIVGFALLAKMKAQPLRGYPYAVILMGLASFIYHATNNYLTQFFDFIGMFLMMAFLLSFNVRRLWPQGWRFYTVYWFLVFVNTAIFMIFDIVNWPVQPIMMINTVPIIILDLTAGYREGRLREYGLFGLAVLFLVVAQGFAIMDIQRIWCEPENLFLHGHVMWHLVGSLGMLFAGLHLKRIGLKD